MNSLMIVRSGPVTDLASGVNFAPFILGIFLIALLAGAMWWDGRRRAAERAPRPEEQPKPPGRQAHIEEVREPDEDSFPDDGGRLLPYNLKPYSTHSGGEAPEAAPEQEKGGGGPAGSGGPGG
ncbi:DUF6479 family protein [Streptomyces sp. NPDC057445]|uniref:DUF6479 family protein n=1 Tax=Streptomyces sp. NPDC057445 TaxID=3346136 RepID=UPI0036A460F8